MRAASDDEKSVLADFAAAADVLVWLLLAVELD